MTLKATSGIGVSSHSTKSLPRVMKKDIYNDPLRYQWKYRTNPNYFGDQSNITGDRTQSDANKEGLDVDIIPYIKNQHAKKGDCSNFKCWIDKAPYYDNYAWAPRRDGRDWGNPKDCTVDRKFTGLINDHGNTWSGNTNVSRGALCAKRHYKCPDFGVEPTKRDYRNHTIDFRTEDVSAWGDHWARNVNFTDHVRCEYPIDSIQNNTQAKKLRELTSAKKVPVKVRKGLMKDYCNRSPTNLYSSECSKFCQDYPDECGGEDWARTHCKGDILVNLGTEEYDPMGYCQEWCDFNKTACRKARKEYCVAEYERLENDDPDKLEEFVKGPCACFLPDKVYDKFAQDLLDKMPENVALENYIKNNPTCFYPNCAQQYDIYQAQNCAENLQICTQDLSVGVGGDVDGDLTNEQQMKCIQDINNDTDEKIVIDEDDEDEDEDDEDDEDEDENDEDEDEDDEDDDVKNVEKDANNNGLIIGLIIGALFLFLVFLVFLF